MSPDGNFICVARANQNLDVLILRLNSDGISYTDLILETSAN